MVTPHLEKLILCGKAFFKTFVAGGDKHTLTFGNDRFIIITDITYFPMNITTNTTGSVYANHNTQVAIYGERGYNHFIFRNYNNTNVNNANIHGFCSPITINLFLLHEQQVGFSFCNAPYFSNAANGIADTINPGYAPPLEWGIDGQPGAVSTLLNITDATASLTDNFTTRPISGTNESQQLFFPFDIQYLFSDNDSLSGVFEYPLLHVNYVEVLGSSNNIQI